MLDGAERARRVRAALAGGPDWERLERLARAHRLAALVERALADEQLAAAGAAARASLAAAARRDAYASVFLAGELPGLLERFAAAGLQAVPYKGPTLAVAAYASLALRPFADLDLVVRWRDFEPAKRVLRAAGFAPSFDEWARVRSLSHEQAFEAKEGRLQVDLHGRLFSRELFPVDLEELAPRLATVRLGRADVATFAAEELLVILCEHAHKHLWQRLIWIADLAHLVAARPELDWERLAAFARRTGSRRVLGIGLRLAAELLAAPVPPAVLEAQHADAALAVLIEEVRGRLFAESSGELSELELALSRLQWRSRERLRDRLRYALTPNESDWIVWPLPRGLRWLYYVVRPLRLLAKYGLARVFRLRRAR